MRWSVSPAGETVPRHTIRRSVTVRGIGLHTGVPCAATLRPAPAEQGIVFRRTDLPDAPVVPADLHHVVTTERRTALGRGGVRVETVEHLLGAAAGMGVDDLLVEVGGPELPAGDGSALAFARAIADAGVHQQEGDRTVYVVESPLEFSLDAAYYRAEASQAFVLAVTIEWAHPLIGRQAGRWAVTPDVTAAELAPARTFGFANEAMELWESGLARGAGPASAIVLTSDGLVGPPLRFQDEFLRHKTLDLLGDLALLGGPVRGCVTASRPHHRANVAFARALERHCHVHGALRHGHPAYPVDSAAPLSPAPG